MRSDPALHDPVYTHADIHNHKSIYYNYGQDLNNTYAKTRHNKNPYKKDMPELTIPSQYFFAMLFLM